MRLVRDAKPKPTQILSNSRVRLPKIRSPELSLPPGRDFGRAGISSRRIPTSKISLALPDREKIRQELARRKIFRLDANNSCIGGKYPYSAKANSRRMRASESAR